MCVCTKESFLEKVVLNVEPSADPIVHQMFMLGMLEILGAVRVRGTVLEDLNLCGEILLESQKHFF